MAKNLMAKKTTEEKPYQVWASGDGWRWLILKSYQADNTKEYARAFCAVSSPFTFGGYDYGDVYWADIVRRAVLIEDNTTTE